MSRRFAAFRLAAFAGLALSSGAAASGQGGRPCAARTLVIERLAERFGETLQSAGLHPRDGLVEVYASRTTGTWTILVTSPEGVTCLVASGDAWQDLAPPAQPGRDA